ncbi:MAG TPA: malonyl-ACP O-methyltransferase BioC [Steroidobacteraceae bacterium]|nr:malonyl-ACP O-methyltransferase BioC [Steroidobacteraceae bacterium]
MTPPAEFRLDRAAVRRSFGRASAHYHEAARLQSAVGAELLERLQFFSLEPRVIIDLGAGTGRGAAALRARFPRARVIAVDLVFPMLQEARRRQRFWRRYDCVCADGCALPFAAQSIDLVYCNLMLQWCAEPAKLFEQLRRVLRPGGLLLFSSFGPATLQELRSAWASVDTLGHVSAFTDMPQLGEALMKAGLSEPVMDQELRRHHYADVYALMNELREIGARHAAVDRRRSLTGPHRLRAMAAAYEKLREAAGLPASWEVICGAAFAGRAQPDGGDDSSGGRETAIPLDAVRRHRR